MKSNQSIGTYWQSAFWMTICLLLFSFNTYAHTPWARFAQPQWDFIEEGNLDQAICGYKGWVVYGEDGPWQCDKDGILYPETVVSLDIEYPPLDPEYPIRHIGIFKDGLAGQKLFKKARFHSGVYYLPDGVFAPCEALEEVQIADGNETFFSTLTELYRKEEQGDALVWASCNTTGLQLPDNTARIAESAMANCKNLSWVTLPESLQSIGAEAFKSEKLAQVVCNAAIPPVAESSSFANYSAKLYVPAQSIDLYRSTEPWCNFAVIGDATGVDSAVRDTKTILVTSSSVSLEGFDNGHISVYNMSGIAVADGFGEIEFNLPSGIYIIKASDCETTQVKRLFIK